MFLTSIYYKSTLLVATVCLTLSGSVAASSPTHELLMDSETKQGWSGKLKIGLKQSTGNTESSSTSGSGTLIYNKKRWKHTLKGKIKSSKSNGEETAKNHKLSYQTEYAINKKSYYFNTIGYKHNEFKNIDSRVFDAFGYGRVLLKNDKHKLTGYVGAGIRKVQYIDGTPESTGGLGYIGGHYKGQLTDAISLNEEFSILTGKDNDTLSESVTSLNLKMTKSLSLSLEYEIHHHSKVSSGFKKTDTKTGVNLVVNF